MAVGAGPAGPGVGLLTGVRSVAMSSPADGPPIVPGTPATLRPMLRPAPEHAAVPVVGESRWTKVARVFAIVRDIALIVVLVFLIYFGTTIMTRLGDAVETGEGIAPACESPTVDQWGTFCPETPGG